MYKILVVTSYFYPDKGGVASHTYNLYKRLSRYKNFEVTVIASGNTRLTRQVDSMRVERLPFWFKISNTPINPLWFFNVKEMIRQFSPDVILIHTPVPFLPDIAAIASGRIPLILKYHHGGSMAKNRLLIDFLIKFYEKTIFKFILKKAKLIISVSHYVAKNYLSKYGEKVTVISPGVDFNKFVPAKFHSKVTLHTHKILFVANLNKSERYKGLEYLLHALVLIKKEVPKTKLIVVGDGDDLSYYEEISRRLNVKRDVVFKGRLTQNDLVTEYQKCNVFVLPSLFESCPNVLLEAMACAKPTAASDTGGIPEIIVDGENGFLFSPADPKDIARIVIKVLSDRRLAIRIGEAAYKKVKNQFSWEEKVELSRRAIEGIIN